MKKTLEIGKMYKTPWKVTAYGSMNIISDSEDVTFDYFNHILIPDGASVVLLEIKMIRRRLYTSSNFANVYLLKILTEEGEVRYIEATQAGMDYWKAAY